jgi:hypothetical protein
VILLGGQPAEDQILTADTSQLSDVDGLGTLHFQWQHDAPVLDNTLSPALISIPEDLQTPASTLVSTLLAGAVTDVDAGSSTGITVYVASSFNGLWQFKLTGTPWQSVGAVSDAAALLLSADASMRFIPKTDFNGTVRLYYRAWDGTQGTAGGTFKLKNSTGGIKAFSAATENAALRVTPVNDKPVLSFSGSIGYMHDKPAITLAPYARVTDIDSADFEGGQLTVWITTGAGAANLLAIGAAFTVDANNNVVLGSTIIGTLNSGGGQGTTDLVVTFKPGTTQATVQQLVRAITFKTVGGAAGQRKVVFTVSDGDVGLSAEVTKAVNVG